MANVSHLSSAKTINPLPTSIHPAKHKCSSPQLLRIRASRKNNEETQLITKKGSKSPRRVITIPAASTGRWHGKWTCEYLISLKDLRLDDLAEDGPKDTEVFVSLSLQKHTGFGLSVDGRVVTSISRKCSSCSSTYLRTIDTSVRVWVLPDGRDDPSTLPEIGGDDPSVIYVKPGSEADLDSLIQDTIRLQTAVKETCSESCEKSEPKLHYIGAQRTASLERRWSTLLQLRNTTR